MLIGISIMIPFRGSVVAFILGNNVSSSYFIGVEFCFVVFINPTFYGHFSDIFGLFNGAGLSKYTMRLSLLRLWVFRIPLVLLFMAIF